MQWGDVILGDVMAPVDLKGGKTFPRKKKHLIVNIMASQQLSFMTNHVEWIALR